MTNTKQKKVRKFLKENLYNLYTQGYGKQKIKDIHNSTPYIHSENTYKTYISQCEHFADWCMNQGYKAPEEAFKHVKEYGEYLESEGKSAWTIYTAMNAIAKGYMVSTEELGYKPPKRERASVKRSRYAVERDKHISLEKNSDLITFCSCTGLRRRELSALHGTDLVRDQSGQLYVYVKNGKGGKKRTVRVFGTPEEVKTIERLMLQAKSGLVFSHVHTKLDEHYYRSVYASKLYKALARQEIPSEEKYICRKDKAGVVYDKRAMRYVSNQLGHNRVSVIAESYLWNL